MFTSGSLVSCGASFTGNLFGTTNLTTVLFQSGAVYAQASGSNPFGANQPQSVVTFAPGSRYRLRRHDHAVVLGPHLTRTSRRRARA